MKKIFIYFTAVLVAGAAFSCKEEIPYANTAGKGLNSISAMFATGEHKTTQDAVFTTVIDPTQEEIFVIIPWYYPFDSFNQTSAEEIRLTADIDAGCTISPSLGGIHNLADKFYFTFTNKNGVKTRHYITGERRYLDLKDILEFRVDSHDLDGVIDNENHTVTLLATEEIINATAVVSISPHATISPDPATPRSYEDPVQFTVTAHDGSTAIFTVKKGIPSRIPAGYRPGSEKLMWAKKLNDDLGITGNNQTTGIAVTKDHIVLKTSPAYTSTARQATKWVRKISALM